MKIPLTPIRFLRYAEQQFPNKLGIVCGDVRLTYAQFADRARRLAGGLQSLGVAPGDRVAFLSMNCHRLIEAYYGVLEAGAILLPLNIRLAPHELAFILRDAGVKVLFVGKEFVELANAFRKDAPGIEKFVLLEGTPAADWLERRNYDELLAESETGARRLHAGGRRFCGGTFLHERDERESEGGDAHAPQRIPPCDECCSCV